MKIINKSFMLLAFVTFYVSTNAQKIKTIEGDLDVLKNDSSINIEFTYDNMSVGKFDKEADYIAKKKADYNAKEAGRGDTWEKAWVADRTAKFEPHFIELFTKSSNMSVNKNAKYTLIFKTTSIEPGYNIAGGMMIGGRKNAEIDGEVWIVETANKSKKIAVIDVKNAPGRTYSGFDFATGDRILECYAVAGKKLGKFIK
jgi:hypothetical protein